MGAGVTPDRGTWQASRCDTCGRVAVQFERLGFTCGAYIPKPYVPLTDEQQRDQILACRLGEPLPASHPASPVRERCMGTLR